jgi:hypothetical protein
MLAENYRQHAEHYQRIINSFEDEAPKSNDTKPVEKKVEVKQEQPVEDLGLPASMIAKAPVDELTSA